MITQKTQTDEEFILETKRMLGKEYVSMRGLYITGTEELMEENTHQTNQKKEGIKTPSSYSK